MDIKLCGVGGYSEVGKNMTAIKVGTEVVILDSGFYLPRVVAFEEQGNNRGSITSKKMLNLGAIPDHRVLKSWKDNVKAIALSHCHLDHIGAIPYIANNYKAEIIGTPYTLGVLNNMTKGERVRINNDLREIEQNKVYDLSKNLQLEFINVAHSTPETSIIVLHTEDGAIMYANDYKLDNHPVVGKKPNYQRLKDIAKDEGVLCLIVNSLYSGSPRKTPSESVAREMLKDVMLGVENNGKALFATCFASHIARIKSMIEFGKKLDRKILIFGRSMDKYIRAAEEAGIVSFKEAERVVFGRKVENRLKHVENHRGEYFIICTGGQAEPGAILTRMSKGDLHFKFNSEDHIIFSNKVIPVEPNIENRDRMEKTLTKKNVRLFTDIHVSGHGGREDLRDLINMLQPKNIVPTHGDDKLLDPAMELAKIMGYKKNENVHRVHDGDTIVLK